MNLTAENTAVVLDSTADYPEAPARFPNMRFVPLYVRFGDETYKDYTELGPAEFYSKLRTSPVLPATSQPTPQDFLETYESLAGYERIYSLHVSAKLSGTFQSAELAASELGGDRVRTVDSKTASLAIAMLAHAIQRRLARGTTDVELAALVERFQRDNTVVFTLETLEYLQRGGRIGRAAALAGSLLNVRPILERLRRRGRGGGTRARGQEGADRVRAPLYGSDRGSPGTAGRDRTRGRSRVGRNAERARLARSPEGGDRVHGDARRGGQHAHGARRRRLLLVPG